MEYDFSKVNWIIHQVMLDRAYETGMTPLDKALRDIGCNVHITDYDTINKTSIIPFSEGSCTVSYGSIQFNKYMLKTYRFCPGSYFNDEVKKFSAYAPKLGGDILLNDDYYLLPFGEFVRRGLKPGESVFIKPDSGLKTFTGKVITHENFDHEINSMKQIEIVYNDTLCVIASTKPIDGEFRYVIADGEVISKSQYSWDHQLEVRIDTFPEGDALAEYVAKMEYQADKVYFCDIAMSNGMAKVIELNAFSSSGLYACDTDKIAKAVSIAALKEFEESY